MEKMHYIGLAYLLAVGLFVFGFKRLSGPKTARSGNMLAALGMLIAIVATLLHTDVVSFQMIVIGLIIGAGVGGTFAVRVQMTGMPQMVALFNGFGGLASALVATSELASQDASSQEMRWLITIGLSVLIGAVTFTGSVIAFGKLHGLVPSRPITYPGQNFGNAILFLAVIALIAAFASTTAAWPIILLLILASAFGVLLVIPIGGADMPVVISLLNSYSGLAACATGFVLNNQLLIIAGALVGASGLILSNAMCKAMNRSIGNVIFGAFGVADSTGVVGPVDKTKRSVRNYTIEDAAMLLDAAESVVIVPGYGLAVARAQHIVRELDEVLEKKGVNVRYAIHPVAGRMPGHMNVLLAEANIPYEKLFEMDAINPDFESTDVALILGANDVINPAARHDKASPIYGMPILDVDKARNVIICKRSLSPGFAGIDNELFYEDKTMMIFGDAKATVTSLVKSFRDGN